MKIVEIKCRWTCFSWPEFIDGDFCGFLVLFFGRFGDWGKWINEIFDHFLEVV
jgi:hypothetical protein